MVRTDNFPTLRERTLVLLINVAIFYAAFVATTDRLLPTGGIESVWLVSAFALWFLSLLSAPWFIPPRDVLVNGIAAAAILAPVDLSPAKRKWMSEGPNGWVKEVLGFRRFSLRGLDKVRGEWHLVCLALNIRRLAAMAA